MTITTTGTRITFVSASDTNTYVSRSGDYVRVTTPYGYGDIGPANTSYFHLQTDRGTFYFNKPLSIGSDASANSITSYNSDLNLQHSSVTKLKVIRDGMVLMSGSTGYYSCSISNTGVITFDASGSHAAVGGVGTGHFVFADAVRVKGTSVAGEIYPIMIHNLDTTTNTAASIGFGLTSTDPITSVLTRFGARRTNTTYSGDSELYMYGQYNGAAVEIARFSRLTAGATWNVYYDATNYATLQCNSAGVLTIDAESAGSTPYVVFNDYVGMGGSPDTSRRLYATLAGSDAAINTIYSQGRLYGTLSADRTARSGYFDIYTNATEGSYNATVVGVGAAAYVAAGQYEWFACYGVNATVYSNSGVTTNQGSLIGGNFTAYMPDNISGSANLVRGVQGQVYHAGDGIITQGIGLYGRVYMHTTVSESAEITTAFGSNVSVENNFAAAGPDIPTAYLYYGSLSKHASATDYTTAYGLALSMAGGTTRYGLYVTSNAAGMRNMLEGSLQVAESETWVGNYRLYVDSSSYFGGVVKVNAGMVVNSTSDLTESIKLLVKRDAGAYPPAINSAAIACFISAGGASTNAHTVTISGNTGVCGTYFGDTDSYSRGWVVHNMAATDATEYLELGAVGAARVRISSTSVYPPSSGFGLGTPSSEWDARLSRVRVSSAAVEPKWVDITGERIYIGSGSEGTWNSALIISASGSDTSTGHAYIDLCSDVGNHSSEAGGAYIRFFQDAALTKFVMGLNQAGGWPDRTAGLTGISGNDFVFGFGSTAAEAIRFVTDNKLQFTMRTAGITSSLALVPSASGGDLGSVARPWEIYATSVSASANILTDGQAYSIQTDVAVASGDTTKALDFDTGNVQYVTMSNTGTCTISFSNAKSGGCYTIILYASGGSRSFAWGSTITWMGGTTPSSPLASDKVQIITILYAGGDYFGWGSDVVTMPV